jgi:hypothetical protein
MRLTLPDWRRADEHRPRTNQNSRHHHDDHRHLSAKPDMSTAELQAYLKRADELKKAASAFGPSKATCKSAVSNIH